MSKVFSTLEYVSESRPDLRSVYVKSLGTAVNIRTIPGSDLMDGIGPYPFTKIDRHTNKDEVVRELAGIGLVSLTLVADPFQHTADDLAGYFSVVTPYKEHHIVDYQLPVQLSMHHRYEVRKSLKVCQVKTIDFKQYLDDWLDLYGVLGRKHQFKAQHKFAYSYFEMLSELDGLTAIGGFVSGQLVSCYLYIKSDGVVYSHLGASSAVGYKMSCSYAIHEFAIDYFKDDVALDLGGAPDANTADSLTFFKRGFANTSLPVWLCGLVVNQKKYDSLSRSALRNHSGSVSAYFPGYRRQATSDLR